MTMWAMEEKKNHSQQEKQGAKSDINGYGESLTRRLSRCDLRLALGLIFQTFRCRGAGNQTNFVYVKESIIYPDKKT